MEEVTCEKYRADAIEIFAELCELEDDLVEFVLDTEEYFYAPDSSHCTNASCINNLPLLHNAAARCLTTMATIHRVLEQWLFPSSEREGGTRCCRGNLPPANTLILPHETCASLQSNIDETIPLTTPDFLQNCDLSNISTLKSILEKTYDHES